MYLRELAEATPGPDAGRYGRVVEAMRAQGLEPPGLYYLFMARPAAAKAMGDFMQEVMRGPSPLSPGERELIAAFTSARNHCLF
jgi:hypothetical protein